MKLSSVATYIIKIHHVKNCINTKQLFPSIHKVAIFSRVMKYILRTDRRPTKDRPHIWENFNPQGVVRSTSCLVLRWGFRIWKNLFCNQRTICPVKLMASTMLSAAIKRQYSSVLPLLRLCLPVLTKFVEQLQILYFYRPSNSS